jgi:tetratricopeptide (TPR) repeat protein
VIMFAPWRFKLREAQYALDEGRLEEAAQHLADEELKLFLPVQQLKTEVAGQLARRALERASAGDHTAAWGDLEAARSLAGETGEWLQLRQAVGEVAIEDVVHYLKAADFSGAMSRLTTLEKRKIPGLPLASLVEVTRRLESARKLSQRAKFAEALEQLRAAETLRPDLAVVREARQLYERRAERSRVLLELLHAAMAASDWTKLLSLASELLEMSPECRVARDARKRAWAEVGERIGDSRRLGETQHWNGTPATDSPRVVRGPSDRPLAPRFMLWVDAVGGFLVSLGDEVIIGQANPTNKVDIPIQADISRRHVKISRKKEGYVIEPLGPQVTIDGKPITSPALLSDGDEIGLSDSVRLRFRKPHVLSASAKLDMVSRHRTFPSSDGVILMAESCVLGPKWQNHVVCRDWSGDVVLYRQDDRVFCRAMQSIEIDGQLHDGRGPVRPGSQVLGTDFSMTLEAI